MRQKMQALDADAKTKAEDVLTPAQKAKLAEAPNKK